MANSTPCPKEDQTSPIVFSNWEFLASENSLTNLSTSVTQRLEPKVASLLSMLLEANGAVLRKEHLINSLWVNMIVSDEALAKTVSRLRIALSDSATNPRLIETIPKVGYRMLVTSNRRKNNNPLRMKSLLYLCLIGVGLTCLAILYHSRAELTRELHETLTRADSLYMNFSKSDNEAALALYDSVLETEPNNMRAQAGVANALLQRVVRWSSDDEATHPSGTSLTTALLSGRLNEPEVKLTIERARIRAEKAVRQSPNDSLALKSLAFAYSADGNVTRAISTYERAITLDSDAWRSILNLSELYALNNQPQRALAMLENAYFAMERRFTEEPQIIAPWQPAIGIAIARNHLKSSNEALAQEWAQRVLTIVPFQPEASSIYVNSLIREGKTDLADKFCSGYAKKLSPLEACVN